MFAMRRAIRRIVDRNVRSSMLRAMPKRVLRSQQTTTITNSTEQKYDLFTVNDAPTSLTEAEAGSKLTFLKIEIDAQSVATAGERFEFLVYVNRSNLNITSSTPVADFWATTEPVTQASQIIRRNAIRYSKFVIPASGTASRYFTLKKLWKKGLTLYDGDAIELTIRGTNGTARGIYINAIAVTRE